MLKPAARKTIAVDIDEVLFPMAPSFLRYYNDEHGSNYRLEQMSSYFLEDLTGDSQEYMLSKIETFLKSEDYKLGEPVSGSIEAIRQLRKKFRLVLVTARDHFYRGATEEFLEAKFAGLYDELYYTHQSNKPSVRVPKYTICQEIEAIALIDDHLSNVIGCAEHGIEGILFGNYPWNQAKTLPEGVVRAKDWQEVLEHFNGRT
jgi:uncharacterized HAD superfamily protein